MSDTTSAINEVSDEYMLSHYEFRCLTDNVNGRNAWMMTVPISTSASAYAYAGEYEVTIKSDKIEGSGGNFASNTLSRRRLDAILPAPRALRWGKVQWKKVRVISLGLLSALNA